MPRLALLFIFGFILPITRAHAVITDSDHLKENPAATCLLEFVTLDAKSGVESVYGFCSATLVSPNVVLSAAHCQGLAAQKKTAYSQIRCPNGETHRLQGIGLRYPVALDSSADLALFKADSAFTTVPPVSVVQSQTEQKTLLSQPKNCRVAGWGKDQDGKYGKLIAAEIDQLDEDPITVSDEGYPIRLKNRVMLRGKTLVQPGDSGGTMICRRPSDGQWVLVGVPVEGFQKSSSQVELLGSNTDWIKWGAQIMDPSVNDLFTRMARSQEYCGMLTQCLQSLPAQTTGILSVIQKALADLEKEQIQFKSLNVSDVNEVTTLRDRWAQLNESLLQLAVTCTKTK